MRVCIIGGGVIGLAIAFELASKKRDVIVLDSYNDPGMATKAAAGMLEPLALDAGMLETGLQSLALYPDFLARLKKKSLLETGYHQTGIIYLQKNKNDYKNSASLMAQYNFDIQELNPAELNQLESLIQTDQNAIFSPQSAQIEPKKLYYTLYDACSKLGVNFMSANAKTIESSQGRVISVNTKSEKIPADFFIVSAGARSSDFLQSAGTKISTIKPVKGQIITLRTNAKINHVVHDGESFYIVPRLDGRVVVGATSEPDADFDAAIDRRTATLLHDKATQIFPALKDAVIISHVCGFRPYNKDDKPYVGGVECYDNLYAATGHYRNGILLAPHTARAIAKLLA